MRKRLVLVVLAASAFVGVPALAAHAATVPSIPPACVVVHGPAGLTVQVGYAPDGPSTCQQVG